MKETHKTVKLKDRHKLFCKKYIELGFNGTQAAIAAGYTKRSAGSTAATLLADPKISQQLELEKNKLANKFEISRDRIARELALIAFGDIRKIFNDDGTVKPISEIDEDTAKLITGIDHMQMASAGEDSFAVGKIIRVKTTERTKAIELLTKMFGYNEPDKLMVAQMNVTEKQIFRIGGQDIEI